MLKRKIINKAFTIISILSLIYINQLLANNTENNADNSKKCVVYKDGKLMYNPDNPKIHCTTLQILDNFWDDNNNTNVTNPNKRPEDFTEILTEKDIISNGNVVCKNPSASNATFTVKEALEGETISGTCNTGYTGTVSAICQKDSSWSIKNNCFSNCNNLKDMYTGIDFNDTIETISNDEFAYSKCDIGYDGFKKHTCNDGKIETTNQCRLNTSYCLKLTTDIENGSITYSNNNQAINSTATLKCNTGYEVINGNNTIVCNANDETTGKWSAELGKCDPKVCFNPTTQTNANAFAKTSLKYNETAITATCKTDYTGTITATCEANGSWKYTGNCNIVRCPTKLTIDNGSYQTITTSNNSYNTKITGTCNTGYTGTITATCNANGEWVKSGSCNIVSGCTEFAFHTDEQYLNVPSTGFANVKMQVWGAQGGVQWDATRNFGGYGYGELDSITGNKKIRVRIGQYGGTRPVVNYVPIGAGNGGAITNKCYGVTNKTRAGGGGSKIWVDGDFQLQAGGGGGDADGENNVGAGGGGANIDGSSTWLATGGTTNSHGKSCDGQTVTRTSNENGDPNTANHGDNNMSCGGGGGGGYYGGGSCGYALQNGIKHTSGGGGGSGYASSKFKNTGSSTNGTKVGNGFARICWGNSKACNGGAFDHQTSVCDITYSNANSNAVEIYYGNTKGFFRQGQTVKCNGKSFGLSGNNGSSCFTPGKLHEYASEGNSFQAW